MLSADSHAATRVVEDPISIKVLNYFYNLVVFVTYLPPAMLEEGRVGAADIGRARTLFFDRLLLQEPTL